MPTMYLFFFFWFGYLGRVVPSGSGRARRQAVEMWSAAVCSLARVDRSSFSFLFMARRTAVFETPCSDRVDSEPPLYWTRARVTPSSSTRVISRGHPMSMTQPLI